MYQTVTAVLCLQVKVVVASLGDLLIVIDDRHVQFAHGGIDRLFRRIYIVDLKRVGTVSQVEIQGRRQLVGVPAGLGINLTVHRDGTAIAERNTLQLGATIGNDDAHAGNAVASAGVFRPFSIVNILQVLRICVSHRIDDGGVYVELVPLVRHTLAVRPTERTFLCQRVVTPDHHRIF